MKGVHVGMNASRFHAMLHCRDAGGAVNRRLRPALLMRLQHLPLQLRPASGSKPKGRLPSTTYVALHTAACECTRAAC